MKRFASAFLISFLLAQESLGHATGPIDASSWWSEWNFDPVITLVLTLSLVVYSAGWTRLSKTRLRLIDRSHLYSFLLGMMFLVLALLSPIDTLSGHLGFVHMIQHMFLMMFAAPLFAIAAPDSVVLWTASQKKMKTFVRPIRSLIVFSRRILFNHLIARPVAAFLIYAIVLWMWHWPLLYNAALENDLIHDIEHLSFFIAAYFFWRVLFGPFRRNPISAPAGILYLFVTSLHSMILGVLMALAPELWYAPYEETTLKFGLTPLEDQQIAGLIMWMPAGISYVAAAIYFGFRLVQNHEQESASSLNKRAV